MKTQRRKITQLVVALSLISSNVTAQDDLGDNFGSLPPPPPPPSSGLPSSARGGVTGAKGSSVGGAQAGGATDAGGASAGGVQILDKKQKQKFAGAPIEDITNENFPEAIDSFDFPNADISDIVKAISELTGKNFIIDPGVRGKITIIAPSRITVAEAYKAFLSALAINGYAIVPSGSFLKIRTARNAQRDGIETYSGNYFPNSDQMVTKIIHLKHIQAEAVNRDLRILQSKDGEMSPYPPTNSLIISDYGANIERIARILAQLDVPGFEDTMEVIKVKYAKAKDMAEVIMKIVNKGEKPNASGGGAFTAGVPRFGSRAQGSGNQGSAYFMVIPDERTNSLIVLGNKAGFERIKRLLTQLDRRLEPGDGGGVNVYYVKYGDAANIAQTLGVIAKEGAARPASGASGAPNVSPVSGVQAGTQEIFGGDVKISADKGTNSLVIISSKQDYDVILGLLKKIDIQRDQVYVEAIIMEMRASDALDYNIGYFQYGEGGIKAGFNTFEASKLSELVSPFGGTGVILPFGDPKNKVTFSPIGGGPAVTIPSLLGFINFLKQNRNANILSQPQILALDAQEALISVGDRVVTGIQTTALGTTGATQQSFTTEEANIELKVKPFISPEDYNVRLELEASVKQLSNARTPVAAQNSTQPIATRKIKTSILVRNGDTAVLGGLMKEDDFETVSKVPLLGDIPILGWLFKSRNTNREKTNMLIFMTPRIIRTNDDGKKLMSRKANQRLKFIKEHGGRDPYGETMDELQGKAVDGAPIESAVK